MKNIIAAIIVIVCIVAGGVGGNFLRSMSSGPSDHAEKAEKPAKDAHGEKKDDGHGEKKKDDHGKKPEKEKKKDSHGSDSHGGESAESEVYYFKFTREFVVPIIREGRVHSLIILNLNLEADGSIASNLQSMEPKLRDNIMTSLITLSNDGTTFESITSVENYELIRSTVMDNLQSVVASGINNVLIVDMAKQDI
jgi:flagellar basal body-associated protein FliL